MIMSRKRYQIYKGNVSALDSSEAKYDSGTGWPSFKEAHGTWEQNESHTSIIRRPDNSLGCAGTEVLCKNVSPRRADPKDKVHVCLINFSLLSFH